MFQATLSGLVSQWFDEYARLAYWVARRWVRRLSDRFARDCSPDELEELAQDAIARGFDRFAKRCAKSVCGSSDRKAWVCQCVVRGARDAIRAKSRFGSVSDGVAVRDDAMNRYARVSAGFVHGDDNEKQDALEAVHYTPVVYAVQRWELEEIINRELPPHLRATALYAAIGFTQEQSGILQEVSDRMVRYRLQEIRDYLDPNANIYAIVCAALQACMNKPRKSDGQPLLPFLADAME
jgi:DNA-directed RNA polymerase specialized sigma24 family protein